MSSSTTKSPRISSSSFDLVVVGSLNVDLVIVTESHLPTPGQTVRGKTFEVLLGGKGANQACAAARLGGKVAMVGCVGDDEHGQLMLNGLKKQGVDISRVLVVKEQATGVAMVTVDGIHGENTVVVVPGANMNLNSLHVRNALQSIEECQYVVCQNEVPHEAVVETFAWAKARGVKTLLNPAPFGTSEQDQMFLHSLVGKVDVVTPNETEAAAIVASSLQQQQQQQSPDHDANASQIAKILQCPSVIVTLGSQGILLYTTNSITASIPAVNIGPVVDTTGAGDCFSGALALFLSRGMDLLVAAIYATYVASFSVTRKGAQASYPTLDDMPADLKQRLNTSL